MQRSCNTGHNDAVYRCLFPVLIEAVAGYWRQARSLGDAIMSCLRSETQQAHTRSVGRIQRVGSCSKKGILRNKAPNRSSGCPQAPDLTSPAAARKQCRVPEKHLGSHSSRGSDVHRRRISLGVDVDSWRCGAALHVVL